MAYENIGTPTGNNLYITIPLRGTDNWDEKLKDGFFQRVVDHDHTPGKGAAIQEAALDSALQTKVSAIATNTSEIAQNATNITQNAAAILTNTNNITTNTTNVTTNTNSINQLGLRMTTAESDITSLQSTAGSNIKVLVADTTGVVSSTPSTEYEAFSNANVTYNPSSLINSSSEFIAPFNGVYLVNISALFDTASIQSWIKIYVGGTFLEFNFDMDGGTVNTGDVPFNVAAGTAIRATVRTNHSSTHTISVNYTIKQIL